MDFLKNDVCHDTSNSDGTGSEPKTGLGPDMFGTSAEERAAAAEAAVHLECKYGWVVSSFP